MDAFRAEVLITYTALSLSPRISSTIICHRLLEVMENSCSLHCTVLAVGLLYCLARHSIQLS